MVVIRSLGFLLAVVLGLVILVLGVVLSPVLILLAPVFVMAFAGWKFWRFRRRVEHEVRRGRRRGRQLGKQVGKQVGIKGRGRSARRLMPRGRKRRLWPWR